MAPVFYFNTVVICYSCRRQNIGTVKDCRTATNGSQPYLNIIFVSCGKCVELPHVFDPSVSPWRRFVDVRRYEDLISAFGENTVIFKERRQFSITRLGFKIIAQIQDYRVVGDLLVRAEFAAVDDREACGFFGKDSAQEVTRAIPVFKTLSIVASSPPPPRTNSSDLPPPYPRTTFSHYLKNKDLPSLPS